MLIAKLMFSVVTGAMNFKHLLSCREVSDLPSGEWGSRVGGEETQSVNLDSSKGPGTSVMNRVESCRNLQVHIL